MYVPKNICLMNYGVTTLTVGTNIIQYNGMGTEWNTKERYTMNGMT